MNNINEYLDILENQIKYLKNSLNNIDDKEDKKIMLSIIERMEKQKKEEYKKYRLVFWDEYKYIKAKEEIFNNIVNMELTGEYITNDNKYFSLIRDFEDLREEQKQQRARRGGKAT